MQVNIVELCHGHVMEPYANMSANFMQHEKALLFQTLSVEPVSKKMLILCLGFKFPHFCPIYSFSLIQDLCVVQALSTVNGERY